MNIKRNISLKPYNTFGINVNASFFVQIENELQLHQLLQTKLLLQQSFIILGGGSNIIFVTDYEGIVVHMNNKGIHRVSEEEDVVYIEAAAGEEWDYFVRYMLQQNYYGLENLVSIPGTVGASPVQNVGAYGVEAKDYIHEVVVYEIATGLKTKLTYDQCKFGYRSSIFKKEWANKYIISSVIFRLTKKPCLKLNYAALAAPLQRKNVLEPTPLQIAEIVTEIRDNKLPDPKQIGSAGSFFKNPVVTSSHFEELLGKYPDMVYYPTEDKYKLAAGWLIEKTGWKGRKIGNAGVYEKQALVLVNLGGCTGKEVSVLAKAIVADVENAFGVRLEPEAIFVE